MKHTVAAMVLRQDALAFYNPSTDRADRFGPESGGGQREPMKGMNMKTKLRFVAVLMLVLCGTTQSFAHCNPGTGRWLSRDPAEEGGGRNIYCSMGNDLVTQIDPLGLWATRVHHD